MKKLLPALAVSALFAASANAQLISEFRVDQPGTDTDEYFELVGTPGASLDGLHYITLGDGSAGSGSIEAVIDLAGQVIPASGYFLCAESIFTLAATPDLVATIDFENSDNVTHLLVSGFTGVKGDDADIDDDGVIDTLFWTGVLDQIACQETDPAVAGDQLYGDFVVGPDGTFAPGHLIRTQAGIVDAWSIGDYGVNGYDTPGAANLPGFVFATSGGSQSLRIDAGAGNAGGFYLMAWTAAGTSPGLPIGGLTLPLNFDAITTYSLNNANGPLFSNTLGFLDAAGLAYPSLNVPVLDPAFAGVQMNGAAVVYDALVTTPQLVSGAVALDILP